MTGGTKQTGSRGSNPSPKDMSVINTTATLVIRQADDDDDDDDDESRREINEIPSVLENCDPTDSESVSSMQSQPSTSAQYMQQEQGAAVNHVNNGNVASDLVQSCNAGQASTSNTACQENIPLAKRLKMN